MKPTPLLNPYFDLFQLLKNHPPDLQLQVRKKLIYPYSWAIPTSEAIFQIKEYTPLIEIGAGTGYWAWLLKQAGARIHCFDHEPNTSPRWVEIKSSQLSDLAVDRDHTLLLCWPPFNTGMATQSLSRFTGSQLIYIGEWRGRTADPGFHDLLDGKWDLIDQVALPNWPGFRDRVFFFKRRTG
jgi:hypothetical protein